MPGPSTSYHHGNLRRVLLDNALELIVERGNYSFTMRELARKANVTHNAPYRHFADKNELLAALAEEGFEQMSQALVDECGSDCGLDPATWLKCLGQGVVRFALRNPFQYRLMFGDALADARTDYPGLMKASEVTFLLLVRSIQECKQAGLLREGLSVNEVAIGAWSLVHGLSSLLLAGHLRQKNETTTHLLEQLSHMLFEGILKFGDGPRV